MSAFLFRGAAVVKQRTARNFDAVAGHYDDTEEIFSAPVADRLVHTAALQPGEHVLDLGCGTGVVLLRAARVVLPGGQVTGIDLSREMLTHALIRAGDAGLDNIQLVLGDAENPPCADGIFDAMLASLVFYLLPDPRKAARRWLDVLKPGGRIALSWQLAEDPAWAPALDTADSYVRGGAPKFGQLLRHWPLTSVADLESMLTGCGYTHVTTSTEDLPMRYPSPEAWWDSGWARARRISWQHIPRRKLPAAKNDVLRLLAPLRDPADSTITRTPRYAWTTARKPGAAAI